MSVVYSQLKCDAPFNEYIILAGHTASSSSSSRPFLFTTRCELVKTEKVTTSDSLWSDFDFQAHSDFPKYNLAMLFEHLKVSDKSLERWAQNVVGPKSIIGDVHVTAWLYSLLLPMYKQDLQFTEDTALAAFRAGLVPFLASTDNRPACAVLKHFHLRKEWKLPVLVAEVHSSGPYVNSLSKTVADLIDQLRLLRCFNSEAIDKCVGFTFPTYPTEEKQFLECVTVVTVMFKDFRFCVSMQKLSINQVQSTVSQALANASNFHAYEPSFCFIRFNKGELEKIATILSSRDVKQIASKHSILILSNNCYWKYIPQVYERENVLLLSDKIKQKAKHTLVYSDECRVSTMKFLAFPAQLHPLRSEDVSECLTDFLLRTADALNELHSLGFAHLDVRIPNICFYKGDDQYDVILIDVGRSRELGIQDVTGYVGEMYQATKCIDNCDDDPEDWTTEHLDWKQMGLLAVRVLTNYKYNDKEIVAEYKAARPRSPFTTLTTDHCLRKLIMNGKKIVYFCNKSIDIAYFSMCVGIWDEEACRNSQDIQKHQVKSLDSILSRRMQ